MIRLFLDQDISRLLDSGASGRHALFLLAPIVISASRNDRFVGQLVNCVSSQVHSAVSREYAKIPWDGSDGTVISSLLQLKGSTKTGTTISWTDKHAMSHPNLTLAEWLTTLLLDNTSIPDYDTIQLQLFQAWSGALKSASMCLKEKAFRFLSLILQSKLADDPKCAHLSNFLQTLPMQRVRQMVRDRMDAEKRHLPVCSKYLQSCVEFSSCLDLVLHATAIADASDVSIASRITSIHALDQTLFSIDLQEILQARDDAKVRKETEAMKKEEELVKNNLQEDKTSSTTVGEEAVGATEGVAEEGVVVKEEIIPSLEDEHHSEEEEMDVDEQPMPKMVSEDADASSPNVMASVIGKQIFLSHQKLLSLKSQMVGLSGDKDASSDPTYSATQQSNFDGEIEYPPPVLTLDVSELTSEQTEQLTAGSLGLMAESTTVPSLFGLEYGILSDASRCTLYSGTVTQTLESSATVVVSDNDNAPPELAVGCNVIRGPDWKWRDQDGGVDSIGVVESVSPWSGVEGEGMSVRWPNESLYTYRWGADGHFDITHVDVSSDNEIVMRYPPPSVPAANKSKDSASNTTFGDGPLYLGILVRLKVDADGKSLSGRIEYPDFGGAEVLVVGGTYNATSFWLQELQLIRGNADMGWSRRFGREHWQAGTKYVLTRDPSDIDASRLTGSYRHEVLVHDVIETVTAQVQLSGQHLFTLDPLCHFSTTTLSNDNLTVACTGGESRNLALGSIGFTSGIHYWEVKIDAAEFGSVFIGVCEKAPVTSTDTTTSTNRLNRWQGWGFVNFRATYHNSTERIYGDHFNAGDTIGVKLDCEKGTLSFFMDGIKYGEHIVADLGVAFDNLGGKTVYPCIGLRKSGDQISLNTKWVSTPAVSSAELLAEVHRVSTSVHGWLRGAFPSTLYQQGFDQYNHWKLQRYQRFAIRPRGCSVEFDTKASVCAELCRAAGLSVVYLAGDRVKICTSGGRELDQAEEAVILGVYRGFLWYRTETQGNEGAEEGRAWAWYWTQAELIGLLLIKRNGKDMTLLENVAENVIDDVVVEQGDVMTYDRFLQLATTHWTQEMDTKLVEGINLLCDALGLEAYNLSFADITTGGPYFSDVILEGKSSQALRVRCAVLRVLNGQVTRALPFIQVTRETGGGYDDSCDITLSITTTGAKICAARRILFSSTKRAHWDELLRATTTATPLPSDEYEDPREIRAIRINRIQASTAKLALLPTPSDRLRKSVFGQLYREMRTWSDSAFRRAYCGKGHGGQKRAFKVKFLGEGVNDYGGPYRAVFEQIVDELQMDNVDLSESGLLPLLVPCPNRRSGSGSNQDKFVLNPSCGTNSGTNGTGTGPIALELHRFLGKLIGTAVRHGLQMGLDLPSVIWRPLAHLPVSGVDLEQIDVVSTNLLQLMQRKDQRVPNCDIPHLTFTTHLSDGTEAVLKPNGKDTIVTAENSAEYVRLVTRARLTESAAQLNALVQGVGCVLPMAIAPLFTPLELEVLICGTREVDVKLLQQVTEYEGVEPTSAHVLFFWQVLTEMTNDERTKFLRFVWARSRMPNSAKDFPMNFKIQTAHDAGAKANPDQYLPHAQTCFFSLSLPAYTTKEALRTKLIFAIENSPNMDADVRLHNAEGWADA